MPSTPITTTSRFLIAAIRVWVAWLEKFEGDRISPARVRRLPGAARWRAFTLVELLTAMAVFMLILVVLFSAISQTSSVLRQSTTRIEAFQSARMGFYLLTRSLSQATLNAYLDYAYDDGANLPPTRYIRKSELGFVIGQAGGTATSPDGSSTTLPGSRNSGQAVFFEAPLNYVADAAGYGGLESLLNACGYFISFTDNGPIPPHVSTDSNPHRFRLMQMLAPSEVNTVYKSGIGNAWFSAPSLQSDYAMPVADNVIALVIRAQDPGSAPPDITTDYTYDSRRNALDNPQPTSANQLPPNLVVTMVAIDETSAKHLDNGDTPPAVITSALAGKFQQVAQYQADLDDLKNKLAAAGIQYRVFTSTVLLPESKWTK